VAVDLLQRVGLSKYEAEAYLALLADGPDATSAWVRYRALTAARQVLPEITHARQLKLVLEGPEPGAPNPYDHSPAVLRRARSGG